MSSSLDKLHLLTSVDSLHEPGEVNLLCLPVEATQIQNFLDILDNMGASEKLLWDLAARSRMRAEVRPDPSEFPHQFYQFSYKPNHPPSSPPKRVLTKKLTENRAQSPSEQKHPISPILLKDLTPVHDLTMTMEFSRSGVEIYTHQGLPGSSERSYTMRLSRLRLHQYLSYLAPSREVQKNWRNLVSQNPRLLLKLLEDNLEIPGTGDEQHPTLPEVPTEVATTLLRHDNQEIRHRAMTLLKDRSFPVQDVSRSR